LLVALLRAFPPALGTQSATPSLDGESPRPEMEAP
jgi:hypothetical protein